MHLHPCLALRKRGVVSSRLLISSALSPFEYFYFGAEYKDDTKHLGRLPLLFTPLSPEFIQAPVCNTEYIEYIESG